MAARTEPEYRASALAAYRFWRDLGFVVGAMMLGTATDRAVGGASHVTGATIASTGAWIAPLLASLSLAGSAAVFAWCYEEPDTKPGLRIDGQSSHTGHVCAAATRGVSMRGHRFSSASGRVGLASLDTARELQMHAAVA